jgi:hypothetical protein
MVVIFVLNANECPVMQRFVPELYNAEVVLEVEAHTSKKRKKNLTPQTSAKRKPRGGRRVNVEDNVIDMSMNKHLLMIVHASLQFKPGEIISSVELGFFEFEQKFEVVCAQ